MNIKRSYIVIGIILVLGLVGLSLLLNRTQTGVLRLKAVKDTPDNTTVSVQILRDGEEEESVTLKPGETVDLRITTGKVRVDGQAGELRSVDIIDVKSFSTTELTTPSGEERAVQQLASDAELCPIIVNSKVFSYSCEGEGVITAHSSNKLGSSLNTTLFSGVSFSNLKPYKDGLLGFYASAGSSVTDLLYINLSTQSIEIVQLPEDVQPLLVNQPDVVTTGKSSDPQFALMFTQKGKILLFDSTTDDEPRTIKPGKDVRLNEAGRRVTASFSGDIFVLMAGSSTDTGEGVVTEGGSSAEESEPLDAYLFEYDKSAKLTRTLTVPSDVEANGIYKLSGGFYAADQPYGFGFFRIEDNKLSHVYTLEDMSSWTVADGKAYVVSTGTLYEFKPGEHGLFSLHGLFSSTRIIVSSLYTTPQGIMFTGLPDNTKDAPLNVYQVLAKGQKANNTGDSEGTEASLTEPSYQGLDDFLFYGASSFQVDNMRYALSNYAGSSATLITLIELYEVTPAPYDRFSTSSISIINFKARINSETVLNGTLEIHDLSTIRVILTNTGGGTAFDSGIISHKEPPSYNPEPAH